MTYNDGATTNNPIMYINDAKKTVGSGLTESTEPVGTVDADTGSLIIGNIHGDVIRQFDGKIDDMIFYTKVLSDDEVTRNYNAGKRSHR